MKPIRITATADLHGNLPDPRDVPECDILIIAGDVGPTTEQYHRDGWLWIEGPFLRWMKKILALGRAKHIVGIAGNHDQYASDTPVMFLDLPWEYLHNSSATIMGVKIWGSPYTLPFNDWAFMADEAELTNIYTAIPKDTDVLVTHGPPRGILDENADGVECGSHALRRACQRIRPPLHIFGHIHEQGMKLHTTAYGPTTDDGCLTVDAKQTTHANVAAVDEHYKVRTPMFRTLEI